MKCLRDIALILILALCISSRRAFATRIRAPNRVGREHEAVSSTLRTRNLSSVCTISREEIMETVEATATKVLEGVCNPSDMEERFVQLHAVILSQMSEIKESLAVLEERMTEQYEESSRYAETSVGNSESGSRLRTKSGGSSGRIVGASSGRRTSESVASLPTGAERNVISRAAESRQEQVVGSGRQFAAAHTSSSSSASQQSASGQSVRYGVRSDDRDRIYDQQFYASEADVFSYNQAGGGRAEEIAQFNNTVHVEEGRKVYSYYWVITDMTYKLQHWDLRVSTRSANFYVLPNGYRLYLRITPRFSEDSIYLHVGLTKGEYDDSIIWPYNLPMKMFILAHGKGPNSSYDMKSRMWNPWELCSGSNWKKPSTGDNTECLGLGFPHNVINQPLYLWNDCLTVKLNVYVD